MKFVYNSRNIIEWINIKLFISQKLSFFVKTCFVYNDVIIDVKRKK